MANWLNRTTKQYQVSRDPPLADQANWIRNPAMPSGVPSAYCNISGNTVTKMTKAEKDSVDASAKTARDAAADPKEFVDNAASIAGGLTIGQQYRTGDIQKGVHL